MGKFLRNKDGKPNTLRDQFQIGDYALGSLTATSLTVTGNVTTSGGNFVGDGSQLTGVVASSYTVTSGDVTAHQANLSITESQISDLTHYANSDVDAHLNQSNPTNGYVLSWTSGDYAWVAQASGGLADVVDDTTPQLGGNLDLNGSSITGTGSIAITGNIIGDNRVTGSLTVDDSIVVTNNVTMNGGTIQIEGQSGNVSANNISVGNVVTVTGNVTGGNLITGGDVTTVTVTASGAITGSTTITATGNVSVGGRLITDTGALEQFSTLTSATGTVTHDCDNGHIFYHTSPSADFTANFTNLNLTTTYATTVTLVMIQGATARIANAVQIGGSGQTINWQGGSEPTGTNNGIDVITFSILNNSGTYTVLGQLVDF